MIQKKNTFFISLDGPDGGGKTTQAQLIAGYLKAKMLKSIVTREPGGSSIAEQIRSIILNPEHKAMSPTTELLLYEASRAQVVSEVIKPNIDAGISVVCDRFIDSTYAYQGFARNNQLEVIDYLNNLATDGLLPDITFILDVDPVVGIQRQAAGRSLDRLESEEEWFHVKVRQGYLDAAKRWPERIKVINASRNMDYVFTEIKTYLDDLIG